MFSKNTRTLSYVVGDNGSIYMAQPGQLSPQLSPQQQAPDNHSLCSHGPSIRANHCPHSKRNSMISKRGSWFFGNGSVSNMSLGSEPRATAAAQTNSPAVSPLGFLSPDSYTNAIEMKRLRAAST